MSELPTVLRIAIPRPLYSLFDYLYQGKQTPQIGCRVHVPFGNTQITGIIIAINSQSEHSSLRPIHKLLDEKPLLDQSTLHLLTWASQYYHHPLGNVLQNAIPVALRGTRQVPLNTHWFSNDNDTAAAESNIVTLLARSPKQQKIYRTITDTVTGLSEDALKTRFGTGWRSVIKQLEKKQLIHQQEASIHFPTSDNAIQRDETIILTDEQRDCVESIIDISDDEQPKPILLHGVTGSGKTEVYFRAIEPVLRQQKQVLILVPEIGLTPQLLARFNKRFPHYQVGILHSGLAMIERMQAWLSAQRGHTHILIGTRSAIFTPMPLLGLLIIDEEHDSSLKQQEGFRYHARDLAVKRCYDLEIPMIMGTATPSIESLHNVDLERYHYLRLNKRPGTRLQPTLGLQDIRGLPLQAGVSQPLMEEVKAHLESGNQVMLFLNRRGFAPAIYCPQCGWDAQCPHCETNMTYHAKKQRLMCHHCDFNKPIDSHCPDCHFSHITTKGQGTERIENVLQGYFPDTTIIRIDRDTISHKGALLEKLAMINQGNPALIIGTQMLAKGHDFPNLTLVGILDVDQSLFSTDFRAQERLAQLVIQVAGRAGRADKKGHVILQSCQPEHPFFTILFTQGYLAIVEQSLRERKTWHFPPHAYQALIRATAEKQHHALTFLQTLKTSIEEHQATDVTLLGPAPSVLEKRANRYRVQLLITAIKRGKLHQLAHLLVEQASKTKKTGKVRWSIDIDPIDYS